MTTKLEQAARQVLERWDNNTLGGSTITSLREALAEQAKQEPVPTGATHYQPHQKTYYKRVSATEWYLWSCTGKGWLPSKGTSDSSEWIMLSPIQAHQPAKPAEQDPVAFADKYGNVMKAKEKLESTKIMTNWYYRPLYEKVGFDADLYSAAGKLALELECLLLDTKDLSVVSKWWDSAFDALEQWRSIKDAAPVRTKDLTDDEIMKINVDTASIVPTCDRQFHFARAVIAADRELNK